MPRNLPPAGAALLAVVLLLFLLPSALNLPQTNPATTLEYAPVPPSDEDNPPPGGSFSSLGLATSGSLGTGDGDGSGPGALGGGTGGVGKNPRTKRCVGNPPRQTEDPLSPPCVAYFAGDNFGATHKGVTRDEIKLLYYLYSSGRQTTKGWETDPPGKYIDTSGPPREDDPVFVRALRPLMRYFNDRYQLYGRTARLVVYQDRAGASSTPEGRRADAADNNKQVNPFALLALARTGNEDAYLEATASRGITSFGSFAGQDESFFRTYPKLLWGYAPPIQRAAKQFSSYVCTRVVNRPVTFSGNVLDQDKPRKLGLLRTSNDKFQGMQLFASIVKRDIEACGGTFAVERTFKSVGGVFSQGGNSSYADENMAAFQSAGVTTIIWAQGYESEHSKSAAKRGYFPEWVVAGDGVHDGYLSASFQDPTVWQHAWTASNAVLTPKLEESHCYSAIREADPDYHPTDGAVACNTVNLYEPLRQLFTGLQIAGPRLTPDSVDRGFHAIPSIASTDPTIPACFYDVDDYTCVKDATAMWWDPSTPNPFGTAGCWRMPEGGRRYLTGTWPQRDANADKRPEDPCNWFQGQLFVSGS